MSADVCVVGAGIVGLSIALAWKRAHPSDSVVVLEKEGSLGAHASGRNSGVLHAGLYYPEGTMKARFARDGNRRLAALCEERGLPLRRCGKLVVAKDPSEHAGLDELLARARANNVPLEDIDEEEARKIEPKARTAGRALFAPETCSVDPASVLLSLAEEARASEIDIRLACAWAGREGETAVLTTAGPIEVGTVVNAAGLHADRVAAAYGFGERYRILPFRGLYLVGSDKAPPLACHIYPVPDLELPFLGTHFTVTAHGGVKIGPTALPALWREHYGGLAGFSVEEMAEVGWLGAAQILRDSRFRRLAVSELRKSFLGPLLADAERLVHGLERSAWTRWGKPGIRAQLLDIRRRELVMDFCVEGDATSFHVLNAISPGFTCSLPFADWCVAEIEARRA